MSFVCCSKQSLLSSVSQSYLKMSNVSSVSLLIWVVFWNRDNDVTVIPALHPVLVHVTSVSR